MKKALVLALAAAAVGALAVWGVLAGRAGIESEGTAEAPVHSAGRVGRSASGDPVVRLDGATRERVGLAVQALAAFSLAAEVMGYGRLEEDPSRTFVVRAPLAGRVVGTRWPGIGQSIGDGTAIGSVEPRIAPVDRLGMTERLASARAAQAAAASALSAARSSHQRLKALNADDRNVSDRAVEEAAARLLAEEARATAAAETVRAIEAALSAGGASGGAPLVAERGGQVVDVSVQPGESVEAGQALLRVARFDRLVARVEVAAGDLLYGAVAGARIVPVGHEDSPLTGEPLGMAASIDPRAQGQAFLFRVAGTGAGLRPGLAVTAWLAQPGPRRTGVLVPRPALVRHAGKSWVYLESAPGEFTRREVVLENVTAGGWFTRSLAPGGRVVTAGAQLLLSEELKFQIQAGAEKPA